MQKQKKSNGQQKRLNKVAPEQRLTATKLREILWLKQKNKKEKEDLKTDIIKDTSTETSPSSSDYFDYDFEHDEEEEWNPRQENSKGKSNKTHLKVNTKLLRIEKKISKRPTSKSKIFAKSRMGLTYYIFYCKSCFCIKAFVKPGTRTNSVVLDPQTCKDCREVSVTSVTPSVSQFASPEKKTVYVKKEEDDALDKLDLSLNTSENVGPIDIWESGIQSTSEPLELLNSDNTINHWTSPSDLQLNNNQIENFWDNETPKSASDTSLDGMYYQLGFEIFKQLIFYNRV